MKNLYIILSFLLILFVSSCNDDRENGLGDEGQIVIKVDMANVPQVTKADLPGLGEWNPSEVCKIEILQNGEIKDSYTGLSEIPSSLTLPIGEYTLRVTAGEEKSASFNHCFYEGETTFSVTAGDITPVQLACKLKNVLLTIRFTDALVGLMGEDFQIQVIGDTNSQLEWEKENNGDTGYYILSDGLNALVWSVYGSLNGKTISDAKRAGIISPVKSNTNYILTFNYEDGEIEADLSFTLEIKEPDVEDDYIDYTPGTEIGGDGFDINNPESIVEGSEQDVLINITSDIEVVSILVKVDQLTQTAFDLDDSFFDFMAMDTEKIAIYSAKGIIFETIPLTRTNSDVSYSIKIAAEKVKELPVGSYSFDIEVTNEKNTVTKANLLLPIVEDGNGSGDAPVFTDEVIRADIWATHAVIRGKLLDTEASDLTFSYRKLGTSAWINCVAELLADQTTLTAKIQGLESGTTYEYCVNADNFSGDIKEFTTEEARQLPNAGFEEGHGSKPLYFYPSDGEMFWDTGNPGSKSAGVDVTTQSTDWAKSGYSAQLKSQMAKIAFWGRFAAGNIFTGQYMETIMGLNAATAGGRLHFGREFSSRPTKLRGWYKYTCGTINNVDSNASIPDDVIADGAKKDEPDKAFIYFALSDKGEPYEIVNTTALGNTIKLFDKNDENIIAYGEFQKNETTDSLQQFEIELDYRSLTRIPTHIIIVCSASKYGDYFTGSTSSILWLDDFELIYE